MYTLGCPKTLLEIDGTLQFSPAIVTTNGSKITDVWYGTAAAYKERIKKYIGEKNFLAFPFCILTPAFINAHTHLPMAFFRGINPEAASKSNLVEKLFFSLEKKLTAQDIKAFARIGAYESLLSGVGMVWDHYYFGKALKEACEEVGLSAVIAPTLQDLAGPHHKRWEEEWDATVTIAGDAKAQKAGIYAAFGPHASDTVSDKLWKKISSEAKKRKLPLHFHLAQSPEEVARIYARSKLSPSAHLEKLGVFSNPSMIAHVIFASKLDLLLFSAKQTLVSCPFSQMVFAVPADIQRWEQCGLSWTVGTDCVASNDSLNIQKELRWVSGYPLQRMPLHFFEAKTTNSLLKKISEFERERKSAWQKSVDFRSEQWLFEKVTKVPGTVHPGFKCGQIAKGQLANLLLWDPEHPSMWPGIRLQNLTMGDTTQAIFGMMVAGKWIGQWGNFHLSLTQSHAYRSAVEEANKRILSIMKGL